MKTTTTQSRQNPGRHDRAAKERALLEAASALFSKKGYENATTREIAAAAGCAEALIQRYYAGKSGLLAAVVQECMLRTPSVDIAKLPFVDSIEREIQQLCHAAAENLRARLQPIRIVLSRVLVDPDFKELEKIVLRPERLPVVETRLARYQAEGKVDAAVDVAAAAEILVGGVFQFAFVQRQLMRISEREYALKLAGFCEIFARGIAPRKAPAAMR